MSWENLFKDLRIGRIAEAYPLTYLDIGTRDGFQDDLSALAFAVHAIGFEPEPTEFARLSNTEPGPWASRRILPFAISPAGGAAVLHVSNDRNGASLLLPLPAVGERFNKTQFFDLERTLEVDGRRETLGVPGKPVRFSLVLEAAFKRSALARSSLVSLLARSGDGIDAAETPVGSECCRDRLLPPLC